MLLLLKIISAHSIISENTIISINPNSFQNLVWFGFEYGGKLNLKISTENPFSESKADSFLTLFLCTPKQLDRMGYPTGLCKTEGPVFSNSSYIEYRSSITLYITYELVLSNQKNSTVKLNISYEITNPGGEQLSAGILEMKYITWAFAIAWGLMLIIWFLIWLTGNRKRPTLIQVFLMLNCFIWCVFSSIFNYYLHDYSVSGESDFKLFMTSKVLMFFSMVCLFVLLELISGSIGITTARFPLTTKVKIAVIIGIFTFWCILSEVFYGDYLFLVLSGIYILFLVIYLVDIRNTLVKLEIKIERMMDEGEEVIDGTTWHQISMFRIQLVSLVIFLTTLAGVSGFYQYYKYMPWVGMGTQIYIIFLWILILSFYFRFRQDSPYLIENLNA